MNYFSKAGLALTGLLAATALTLPAHAQTELTMYYPIAVGGPLTNSRRRTPTSRSMRSIRATTTTPACARFRR